MLQVDRDDARRRLVVTVTGAMTRDETAAFMSEQMRDGTWHYGVLYDLARMTTSPDVVDLGQLARHVDTLSQQVKRGPVAIIGLVIPQQVARVEDYIANLQADGLRMALFKDVESAERWLDANHIANS